MRIRLPAGVTVRGKAWGGRFVSERQLRDLLARTDDAGRDAVMRLAEREGARAERAYGRVARRFDDDPKRYAARAAAAEQSLFLWQSLLEETVQTSLAADELARARTAAPPAAPTPRAIEGQLDRDRERERRRGLGLATEFEVGVEYVSSAYKSSNVDITIRVRRFDGRPMTRDEARHALFQLRASLIETGRARIPAGFELLAINWRRPTGTTARGGRGGGQWRGPGTAQDLDAFSDVLNALADTPGAWTLRLGAVDDG